MTTSNIVKSSSMSWNMKMREYRHNPCLMRPISVILIIIVSIVAIIAAVCKLPTLILSLLLAPLLNRFQYIVEFWYPTSIGKWLHLTAVRWGRKSHKPSSSSSTTNDANRGCHSRCLETRIEIIPGRVFVHPIPQLLDNLGYLVVCLPSSDTTTDNNSNNGAGSKVTGNNSKKKQQLEIQTDLGKISVDPTANAEETNIVAFIVDCGDADAVAEQVDDIKKHFYNDKVIHVQSVLSTHKHHDHTAGNHAILTHPFFDRETIPVKLIFGGAVEQVPACNYPLVNGDKLPLPKAGENDMNQIIEVEAVATPAHTRGSLTYILRPLTKVPTMACLFTGDTMFSGGGGVPFESDIDPGQEENITKMTANSYIKASAATNAVERCFAEVLYRSIPPGISNTDNLMVFPGHEYTNELLARQLSTTNSTNQESCKWKLFTPLTYFETVSQLYVALHRRTLPHSSGKIMTVPSSIKRELYINPHFRSLKQRGVVVVNAIRLWGRNFTKEKIPPSPLGPAFESTNNNIHTNKVTKARENQWNMNADDISRDVFTTVYSADLESIIHDLDSGAIDPSLAASRLKDLKSALDRPVVGRRPIPGTLPSSKQVYRGLLGLAMLGSSPTALTMSDSVNMKLHPPIDGPSDRIRINKKRLIAVLYWLGLLDDDDGKKIVATIHQLWKEVHEYMSKSNGSTSTEKENMEGHDLELQVESPNYSTDSESVPDPDDEVDLGALKWVLYGIPEQKPRSFFTTFCTPCCNKSDDLPSKDHPAGKSSMNRHSGELVRHDVLTCPLCRAATGCPALTQEVEEINTTADRPTLTIMSSTRMVLSNDAEEEEASAFVEVSPHILLKDI